MKEEWKQEFIKHCPMPKCKGMLLQHPMYHEYKCSDCEKYFLEFVELKEVEAPKNV